jgi:hypothetical protein
MITLFDFLAVACFVGLLIAFFQWTDRNTSTLLHMLIPALVFAIANQVGNAGFTLFSLVLIVAGVGYAALIVLKR